MAGRGRGSNSYLTYEQRQSMGIGRGEGPGPTLAPPPLYPKMENPPLPLTMDASMDYMLILKKQFVDFLHDSPAYVQPDVVKTDIERYSDKYKVLSIEGKNNKSSFYHWPSMPRELRPAQERNSSTTSKSAKRKAKQIDVTTKLKKLEALEKKDKTEEDKDNAPDGDKSSDEEGHESDKEEVDDADEEMDDNTDYLNNYFDNGEGFEDEDDNLDEGPVY